jgi:LAO/AO transport system kinase
VGHLLASARGGERAALARLLSMVERGGDDGERVGRRLVSQAGDGHATDLESYTIGVTGAPGAGKSTLTSALIGVVRGRDERVAVLAIDPSSPFSGGAILGDRLRMGDHALDDGVFIRSMASRGHLGGLAVAAPEAVRVLAAAGFPYVMLETVGVGQAEVEVASHADTTVVVVNPGWGDAVQASKAGLLEIADVFVVNKADRPGADEAVRDLEQMLDMAARHGWRPPVLRTTATTGEGVDQVWRTVADHRAHLVATGGLTERRRRRAREEVSRLVTARLAARTQALTRGATADELADAVAKGELDPWSAADELLGAE